MSDKEYSLVMLGVAIGSIGALVIGLAIRELVGLWEDLEKNIAALRALLRGIGDDDDE